MTPRLSPATAALVRTVLILKATEPAKPNLTLALGRAKHRARWLRWVVIAALLAAALVIIGKAMP